MIYLVSGTLGSGKSYFMVRQMLDHLKKGFIVATNIQLLHLPEFEKQIIHIDGDCLPTDLPSGDRRGKGKRKVMIVIDEALSWFGSRGLKDPKKDVWGDWLRHSDKLGQDIYLIAQEYNQIAKWIRVLSQFVIFCHNSKNYKIFRWLPFRFGFYVQKNSRELENETAIKKCRPIKRWFLFYSASIYQFYDTSETYESDKYESTNIYEKVIICPKSKEYDHALKSILYTMLLVFLTLLLSLRFSTEPIPQKRVGLFSCMISRKKFPPLKIQ